MKILIIGGGIIGLAVARQIYLSHPNNEVILLEKEKTFGHHQSTHNSGVLHAGLYYKPGSLKGHLAVKGIRQMVSFCEEHQIKHEICGKLVVATNEVQTAHLRILLERGRQNGLVGLKWLKLDEMKEIEPHVGGVAGIQVPEEGIVDYRGVCDALVAENKVLGTQLHSKIEVTKLIRDGSGWIAISPKAEFRADFIINCAGLHCDRIAQSAGEQRDSRIVPFRGEYYSLKPCALHLVRSLIYPVPDPEFPFLGVHFTRLISGEVEAGPNAILALAREGYSKWKLNPSDIIDVIGFKGTWRFLSKHRRVVWEEAKRSFSRRLFCKSLQQLVPQIQESDLMTGGAGVRAQAMEPSGNLVQDFAFIKRFNALHVINAPSPAATAALSIAEHIVNNVLTFK